MSCPTQAGSHCGTVPQHTSNNRSLERSGGHDEQCKHSAQVCRPDQMPQLARAVAAAALLLPAALPASALAAVAEAGQAPPPQRWLTLAVLLGACGLAAAQQLSMVDKTAPAS